MGSYKLSLETKADLREIYRYGLVEHGETQADRYFAEIFDHFEQIADQPFMYPAVDHIHDNYRRVVCGAHSIYYRIERHGVTIMRILGRQNTDRAL